MGVRSRRSALPSAWPIAGGRITVALVVGRLSEGAPQRQLVALARTLDRRRHAVRVYCLSDITRPHGPELEAAGYPVRVLAPRGAGTATRLVTLARALRRDGIDVAHGLGAGGSLYTALAARLARIVTVVLSVAPSPRSRRTAISYVRADALRRATVVLVGSHADAARLHSVWGVASERLRVVYEGVDLTRFPAPTRLDGLKDRMRSSPFLVAVGATWTSADERGLFTNAAARVLAARPDTRFLCLGAAEDRPALETLAKERELPVDIVIDPQTRARDLARTTLLWALGSERPVVRALLEAMAAGRPVVAVHDVDSAMLVADGISGLLVEPGDAGNLAGRSIELSLSTGRRRELGLAARARVERSFSASEMVRSVAGVYQQALLGRIGVEAADATSGDAALAVPDSLVKNR